MKRPFNSSGTLLLRLACRSVATWLAFTAVVASGQSVRFAVIGDYGNHSEEEERVAAMVKAWRPDFILTVGDNAYSAHTSASEQDAFQKDVVAYYSNYIVRSSWDPYAHRTRFFPSLGNNDYKYPGVDPLAAYKRDFAVPPGPGGHHYYEFARGPVRFFALNSNKDEYTKWGPAAEQGRWFNTAIRKATERWKIVFFHHSPYHSGSTHPTDTHMQSFNFERLGVTAVLAGHEHVYERVMRRVPFRMPSSVPSWVPFITNGLGGYPAYGFRDQLVPGSVVHYPVGSATKMRNIFGALFVEASSSRITIEFWNLEGTKIDDWYWPPPFNPPLSRTPAAQP